LHSGEFEESVFVPCDVTCMDLETLEILRTLGTLTQRRDVTPHSTCCVPF